MSNSIKAKANKKKLAFSQESLELLDIIKEFTSEEWELIENELDRLKVVGSSYVSDTVESIHKNNKKRKIDLEKEIAILEDDKNADNDKIKRKKDILLKMKNPKKVKLEDIGEKSVVKFSKQARIVMQIMGEINENDATVFENTMKAKLVIAPQRVREAILNLVLSCEITL